VIPGATVTLLNVETGIQASTISDAAGNYLFTNVKVGSYSVSAEMAGFAKAVASGVTVTVNARQRVDLRLQIGALTETVEVTDAAARLQTDTAEQGQLITKTQIVELPLLGRNYADMALLTTGVTRSPNWYGGTRPREGSFIVNGLRSVFNNFMLDGIDNNSYATSSQGNSMQVMPSSPDSLAEMKVVTNNYSAEYGRSGGGVINVVTKSGTNALHGTAYHFLRNTSLNAAGYQFGIKPSTWRKPILQLNQFGMSIGGPIIKNRAFFFTDYEGSRSISKAVSFTSIPSLDDQKGIFPIAVTNPQTGKVYPANTGIPRADMQPYARIVLDQMADSRMGLFASPTGPGRSNNLMALLRTTQNDDKYNAKIDFQINNRMSTFARWSQRKNNRKGDALHERLSSGSRTVILNQQLVIGYTWTVSPGSIMDARFGISRVKGYSANTVTGGPSALAMYGIPGLPDASGLGHGLPAQGLTGIAGVGCCGARPQQQDPTTYDAKLNYAKIAGKHMIKIGYEFLHLYQEVLDINPINGSDSYAGQFSKVPGGPTDSNSLTTYSWVDFLFGLRSQYRLSPDAIVKIQRNFNFAYVQDDIRATPNLTLNLGLRWEYAQPWMDPEDKMVNFDPDTNSLIFAKPGGSTYERALVKPDYNNFGPRVGFAYSGIPKFVFRGGYGISYIHEHRAGSGELLNMFGPTNPVVLVQQVNPNDPTFLNTQQGYPEGFASAANFDPVKANITYIPKESNTSRVQVWALDVQRELGKRFVLDVAYVGNRGSSFPFFSDYNQAYPQPTPTSTLSIQARRPNQKFGAITWWRAEAWSYYNALQVKLERQFTGGINVVNSFTWGHGIDSAGQVLDATNNWAASPQDGRNIDAEKATTNTDQKLTNVTSLIWDLPVGRGKRFLAQAPPVVDMVLGGWKLTAINSLLSPLLINLRRGSIPAAHQVSGVSGDFRGAESYRPNVLGPVINIDSGIDITENYFNKANVVLSTDPSQPFGNAGRNSCRQTGMYTLDLGIFKEFPVFGEDRKIQFRAEFFNATNRTNLTGANSDRSSAAFGTIRSTYAPRQIQFALKFIF